MTAPTPQIQVELGETVLIVDFGGQTAQLIARRCRDQGALAYLIAPETPLQDIKDRNPVGIILSGGPASVYADDAPTLNPDILNLGIPVLGICYGMQAACQAFGARISQADRREFGSAPLTIHADTTQKGLLHALPAPTTVWMSHGDQVQDTHDDLEVLASTPTCPNAVVRHKSLPFHGVQFHPEVTHTPHGSELLRNFLYDLCGVTNQWRMSNYKDEAIAAIRQQVGTGRVLCGLSGGVDSSVVAALLHEAIGDQLTCVFVDNGLLRKNERELVEVTFRDHFNAHLVVADAADLFLDGLAGVHDPQEKRKFIGKTFIDVFKAEADKLVETHGTFDFLAQGTLYPDVIESGHGHAGKSANIKLHHNVGGLPEQLGFDLIEPLRDLFKDEVRRLGEVLGLPESMVWRHPFPGPGLAVRMLGALTREGLGILRDCDEILLEEIVSANLYRSTSQVFAVLLPIKSVGVMGDGRTYESCVAIRAVTSEDFMTADWARIPYEVLAKISNRIINEVRGVNRVVYDISSKPPATIEWE